jgi:hypothetical protein
MVYDMKDDWAKSVNSPNLNIGLALLVVFVTGLALVWFHLFFTHHHDNTCMDLPMDINQDTLPFPGEMVDGQETIQYFNM